jgi:hypothetical protein
VSSSPSSSGARMFKPAVLIAIHILFLFAPIEYFKDKKFSELFIDVH